MTDLPNGWEFKRLDEIADIVMGQSPPGSSYNEHGEGRPFFQGKTEFGEVHPTVRKYTTAGTKFAKAGDILMSVRAPVGPTNIADIDCVIGRGLAAIRAKTVVSQDYLRWSLKHLEIDIQSKGTGTTFDAITGETLRGTLIALPPLPEQQKIVEILEDHLSRLDAALADVKQAKLKAAQFRRSLLQAAFTGNLTGDGTHLMTDLPDGWSLVTLNEAMAECKNGLTYRNNPELAGFPVSRIETISKGEIDFEKVGYGGVSLDGNQKHLLNPGDILFSHINSMLHVGKVAIYRSGMPALLHGMNLLRITPNDAFKPEFLFYLFQSSDVRKQIWSKAKHAVNQASINIGELKTVVIPKPPVDEQHKIVEILEDHISRLETSVAIANAMEKQSATLRRSLLQAAFTGQLTKEVASV